MQNILDGFFEKTEISYEKELAVAKEIVCV